MGTSWRLPEDSEKELTVHVLPVLSKTTQFFPMTTMFAWESSSVLDWGKGASNSSPLVAAARRGNLGTNAWGRGDDHSFFFSVLSHTTTFMMLRVKDS